MKEASTKPGESVEGEVKSFQGGQVLQLVPLKPRQKVVAEDMQLRFYTSEEEVMFHFRLIRKGSINTNLRLRCCRSDIS